MSRLPKRNHYIPQFYLRQFSCVDDDNKVLAISRHDPFMVTGRKSISSIGYEDNLYNINELGIDKTIESTINGRFETPFTNSITWKKILSSKPESLDISDKIYLYLLIRHLQVRNIENLKFLEQEAEQIRMSGFPADYTLEEREARDFIINSLSGPKGYFLHMASSLQQFMGRWREASITVLTSDIPLRTSTNPVLNVPRTMGGINIYNDLEADAIVNWLPLAPHFGILLTLSKKFCNFTHHTLEANAARVFNRLYLVQLSKSLSVRHCLAKDTFIVDDLAWSGHVFYDGRDEKKRYKKQV